ncbi:hypothetical protein AWENTII_002293 [Aspergillus wentii]
MKRAEARKAEEEKRLKEEQAKEELMGDVQRQERAARKQQLEDVRAMPVARTIEDDSLNDELKAQQRWNDPAAQFLTNTKGPGASATRGSRYTRGPTSRIGMESGLDIGGMGWIGALGLRRTGLRQGIGRGDLRLWITNGRWMSRINVYSMRCWHRIS